MPALLLIAGLVLGALAGAALAGALARSSRERTREDLETIAAENRERMRDELKAISADVLTQTGDSVAQRLIEQQRAEQERAAGEMARRAEEWKGLVQPVHEKLGKFESEIGRLERERKHAQGELASMVRQLHEGVGGLRLQTGNLVSALKGSSTRGSWGELHLRRVIEMAGMVEHCDFVVQSTIQTEDGRLRPDVLVHLPGEKLIVIDSKFPGSALFENVDATEESESQVAVARHAKQLREHITKLASKGYQDQFDSTPELVVMFVPSDGNYLAALASDPTLIEYGVHQGVLIATPTTLIGLLRAIDYGWRQERLAESARQIAEIGRELHKRLGVFVEPLTKVGRHLNSAVDAYNQAARSFDSRLTPKVKELVELGASSGREVPEPASIEASAQPPIARTEFEPARLESGQIAHTPAIRAKDVRSSDPSLSGASGLERAGSSPLGEPSSN
ncbi:MAG TPA: DNA recombination protein RmuC [Solirubrobacteraceae bacterium]